MSIGQIKHSSVYKATEPIQCRRHLSTRVNLKQQVTITKYTTSCVPCVRIHGRINLLIAAS